MKGAIVSSIDLVLGDSFQNIYEILNLRVLRVK